MNEFLTMEHLVMFLTSKDIPIEKRIDLCREQVELHQKVVERLNDYIKLMENYNER
jgi:hypothetical protein